MIVSGGCCVVCGAIWTRLDVPHKFICAPPAALTPGMFWYGPCPSCGASAKHSILGRPGSDDMSNDGNGHGVRTYAGGEPRTYSGLPNSRFYAQKFRQGQARPVMEMTVAQAQDEVMRRIRCYCRDTRETDIAAARREILGDDDGLRQAAYPLPGEQRGEPSQERRAAVHQDQLAALLIKQRKAATYSEAVRMVNAMAPAIAAKAGAHPDLMPGAEPEGAVPYAKVTGAVRKTYAGPGPAATTHEEAATTSRETLIRQIAADALARGEWRPGPAARAAADFWFGVTSPAPPPGSPPGMVEAYNKLREATINLIVEEVRRLLADPAQRAALAPGRLP